MIASTLYGVWQNMMSVKAGEEARGRALEAQIDAIFSAYPTVVAALRGGDTQAEQAVATAIGTSPGWIDSTGINQFAQYGIPDSVAKAVGIDWWWNTVGNAGMMSQSAGSGMIGDTAGPTRLTVGEAGKETVAVLRNPRQVDLAAAAGQGGGAGGGDIHFTINIDARGSLADANQLHLLVRNKFIPEIARIARTFTRSNSRSGGRPIFETGG
jgi:hypothetical protein